MKDLKLHFLLFLALPVLLAACTKQGPIGPQGPKGDANVTSITFSNVTVPTNSSYTFDVPALTQAVLDSGTVAVYYENPSITPEEWLPLPQYYFFNGNLVWLIVSDLELGQVTVSSNNVTGTPFTWRVVVTAAN